MEIGDQIRALRTARGITQEEMAQHFGLTAQAVSKWERGAAAPDISLLPELSAYFGVTIDELFSLSDDTRMERIENMLEDVRCIPPESAASSRQFLLEKARREPTNGRPHALLAELESHLAGEHDELAAEYAREALRRDPDLAGAQVTLVRAMRGKCWDWCETNHHELIRFYQDFLAREPDNWHAIMWLMDQLIDDGRLAEAEAWRQRLAQVKPDWRPGLYAGALLWHSGKKAEAYAAWEALAAEYPGEWCVQDTIADFLARDGEYDRAADMHRRAFAVAKAPRFADPLISIAMIREIQGDVQSAIEARREQLALLRDEWHILEGEGIDAVQREIARLEKRARRD